MSNDVIYAKRIVPGLSRFYSGHFQNTPNIKTFFGYAFRTSVNMVFLFTLSILGDNHYKELKVCPLLNLLSVFPLLHVVETSW